MKRKKVSVVVPAYNAEKYVDHIVEDFLGQSDQNFEVIFVDDGSTDQTHNLLQAVEKQTPLDIKVIHQKNGGVSHARNTGLQAATGEYVVFVDVDDRVSPHYLSHLLGNAESFSADVSICRYGTILDNDPSLATVKEIDSLDVLRNFLYERKGRLGIYTLMTKRSLLLDYNIRFEEGFAYGEDLHMIWRILTHAKKLVISESVLYHYEVHNTSAMARFTSSRFDAYALAKSLESYFQEHRFDFADEYILFGAARVMWGIMWQAAILLGKQDFRDYVEAYPAKAEMKKLHTFPDYRVRITSVLFCISSSTFYSIIHALRRYLGTKSGLLPKSVSIM